MTAATAVDVGLATLITASAVAVAFAISVSTVAANSSAVGVGSYGSVRTQCRGQNSIVPHNLRRPINVLPTLPIEVRIQEKISDLTGLSNILLQRLR